MTRGESGSRERAVWDVHAHYLPTTAPEKMGRGQVQVRTETIGGLPDSITVNGMAVGATVQQLSDVQGILCATEGGGIDRRVPPFTYRYWDDPDDTLELASLLNEATATVVETHRDRFLGLATVPLQDTKAPNSRRGEPTRSSGLLA